jgi:hypothetical protein
MGSNIFPADTGGIPSGNTAARPASPVIGDTYYNGQLEILEIFNGTIWVASSAPPATPSIATPTDVGTNLAYTTGGSLTTVFTPGSGGGTPSQYNAFTTTGGFSANSSSTTVTITGLTPVTSFIVYGNAQNNFGTTVNTVNSSAVTVTTLPEVRTIGTATASGSANEVTVTWTNGSNGGKTLSAITITPFLNGTTAETSRTAASISSTSYTFTQGQLTAGAAYTFKVKATNANGTCADSTATNSATMPNFLSLDYLVVAGGGGGGGGGGGAGGLRSTVTATGGGGTLESTIYRALSTNYTVTVGAGGALGSNISSYGSAGGNSVFDTITSSGGGGGAGGSSGAAYAGSNGGCGGGSAGYSVNTFAAGGSGTANQGYAGGGSSGGATDYAAGGGGGAGAVGVTVTTVGGGAGGAGVASSITGSSVTYSVGGGGYPSGGGASAANLGKGGDGKTEPGGGNGRAGGSGIVILRYADTRTITIGAGLTGTESSASGGYKRATITAGTGNVSWA